jgi:hypothetical protein
VTPFKLTLEKGRHLMAKPEKKWSMRVATDWRENIAAAEFSKKKLAYYQKPVQQAVQCVGQ